MCRRRAARVSEAARSSPAASASPVARRQQERAMRQIDRETLRAASASSSHCTVVKAPDASQLLREGRGRQPRVGERAAADQKDLLARELRGEFIECRVETRGPCRVCGSNARMSVSTRGSGSTRKREHRQQREHQHAPGDEAQAQRRARSSWPSRARTRRARRAPGGVARISDVAEIDHGAIALRVGEHDLLDVFRARRPWPARTRRRSPRCAVSVR